MSSVTIRRAVLVPLALAACAFFPRLAVAQMPTAPMPGVKGDILMWVQDAENKLIELAAATPQNKFSWRPGKDVRTTGEVFMHVVTANYGLPNFAGVKPPEGFDFRTHEKSLTKKEDIEKALKESFAHMKKALTDTSEADLNKPTEFFGMKSTYRGVYLLLLSHAHEHLGQSIAYARMNKVAPPWTARMKAQFEAMQKAEAAKKAAN
jgi:uncharacterized damage-inducible protein DinB